MKIWEIILLFALVCVGQAWLTQVAVVLQESDQLMFHVWGIEALKSGQFSLYPFDMNYGCTWVPMVQNAWAWAVNATGLLGLQYARFLFDYCIFPFFMASTVLWSLRRLGFEREAFWVAGVCAIGFPFWVGLAGIGFYLLAMILGLFWLVLSKHFSWQNFSLGQLFWVGLFAGLTLVNFRAGAIYIVASLTPWDWVWAHLPQWKSTGAKKFLNRAWLIGVGICLGLFLILQATGPDLGNWFGRPIRVHAFPNLQLAFQILALGLLIQAVAQIWREKRVGICFKKLACIGVGLGLGILPEWIRAWKAGQPLAYGSSAGELQGLSRIWQSLVQLHAGDSRFFISTPLEPLKWAGLILSVLGGVSLIRTRNRSVFAAVIASGVLSVAAYCTIHGTNPGAPRYLLFIFPFLLVGWASALRDWPWVSRLCLILFLGFVFDSRFHLVSARKLEVRNQELQETVGIAHQQNVASLYSDDYEQTFRYTVQSNGNLLGTQIGAWPDMPTGTHERLGAQDKILILHTRRVPLEYFEAKWALTPLKKMTAGDLYLGTKK